MRYRAANRIRKPARLTGATPIHRPITGKSVHSDERDEAAPAENLVPGTPGTKVTRQFLFVPLPTGRTMMPPSD